MDTFIALLRGINVGGNNILPMTRLKALCERVGFKKVTTFIQSGNVVFQSSHSRKTTAIILQDALQKELENPVSLQLRTLGEIETVVSENPFPDVPPAKVGVLFLDEKVDDVLISQFGNVETEQIAAGRSEVFVYYPDGMGRSKLKFPKSAKNGTVRNINTVRKLVELAGKTARQ